ncbi:MAG: DUF2207 domain-containing protein, partial [Actinomycetota bacterium]|nr:DUF2207 domain-containing protein [Actinomycetota bacterium]
AWLALLGALAVATRAREPDARPASMDGGGDEPPAVVNMITDGWEVGGEAVPATLLDLAARKVVAIDSAGLDQFVVRVRPASRSEGRSGPRGSDRPDLTPYEEQVLDHVRRLAASDGTVPAEALTTGPQEQSKAWWKSFTAAVVRDARDRGLSRARWSKWMLTVLGAAAVVPAVLAALAIVVLPTERSSDDDNPVGAFVGLTVIGWGMLMAVPGSLRAERDTPGGLEAAGRWLGLREHLEGSGGFEDAPPAAVAIWDRYLAYGAALGVAPGAVRALPLGSESDTVAWSHYSGRWRRVRVAYPKRVPPGWGRHPALATAIGLAGVIVGLFVARIFYPAMADATSQVLESLRDEGFEPLDLVGVVVIAIPTVVTTLWLVRSAAMLMAAVPDLFVTEEVEGVVLRFRQREEDTYIAVDDGTRRAIRAWRVEPAVAAGVTQGELVRATVRPRLGHVLQIRRSPRPNSGS